MNFLQNFLLILVSVFLSAGGQIVLKLGANHPSTRDGILGFFTLYNILGLGLYGLSAVMWMLVLRKVELSYAYPMVSLGYVLVVIASYYIFGESINTLRVAGLVFIMIGIVFISRS
ncbi:EamA family transporter [Falsibacillus pallidus]|uniref:EamA family transporter n=1 Tax=Falsibacillus pallidus TaxID=493781 RepID=UPI003D99AB9F